MRFIAFYLPQFHPIPENDIWWGKGFTEWHAVVQAKKLFYGHKQPRVPADLGFYDLRLEETRIAQAELAKKYGVDGFCYWHYWFGNKKRLLERPFTEVVTSGNPDFPFCLGWANGSWEKKKWDKNGTSEILIKQLYQGVKDYEEHFYALLPAFKDSRYIRVNGKLFFIIYIPLDSLEIKLFIETWRKLAKQNELDDFYFIGKSANNRNKQKILDMGFDAIYNDDVKNIHHKLSMPIKVFYWITRNFLSMPTVFDYKKAMKYMISQEKDGAIDTIPVIAPNWDHSPRSGTKAIILKNAKPELFQKLVINVLNIIKSKPEENQIVLIKSWNEWGEGNYLEPDTEFGLKFLEALKAGIKSSVMSSVR